MFVSLYLCFTALNHFDKNIKEESDKKTKVFSFEHFQSEHVVLTTHKLKIRPKVQKIYRAVTYVMGYCEDKKSISVLSSC